MQCNIYIFYIAYIIIYIKYKYIIMGTFNSSYLIIILNINIFNMGTFNSSYLET